MSADMYKRLFEMVSIAVLALNALKDIRDHEISLSVTMAGAMAGVLCTVFTRRDLPAGLFLSMLPGFISLLLTRLSGGEIGGGDGLLLGMLGLFYPVSDMVVILSAAFFLSALYSILLLGRHHKIKDTFAFVPFLLAGTVVLSLIGG